MNKLELSNLYDLNLPREKLKRFDNGRFNEDYSSDDNDSENSSDSSATKTRDLLKISYSQLLNYGYAIESIRNASAYSPYESIYFIIPKNKPIKSSFEHIINDKPQFLEIYLKRNGDDSVIIYLFRVRINKKELMDKKVIHINGIA